MRTIAIATSLPILVGLISSATLAQDNARPPATKQPAPLLRAHSHNDYEHQRPLLDALDHGFCGVEADIYLVDGKLLVAHDRDKVKPDRTLQALYLDPLRERVRQNNGRVYRGGPSVTLLIDVKSDAEKTYAVLREVLKEYVAMLTRFSPDKTETNAVTIVISGNRSRQIMTEERIRYAAYDGRLDDLTGANSKHLIPLISDNWSRLFKWNGVGPMPEGEKATLVETVTKAHQQGRRVRFWATPDVSAVWNELLAAGVDLINTDDLAGLERLLRANQKGL
jgi:hypothetical protein